MSPRRDGTGRTNKQTRKDRATQLLICASLSFAICLSVLPAFVTKLPLYCIFSLPIFKQAESAFDQTVSQKGTSLGKRFENLKIIENIARGTMDPGY